MLKHGTPAPVFSLPDQHDTRHELKQYRGQWVLLYFYPKDLTPGCTVEACSLRDVYDEFHRKKATILGVSADSVTSHQKFATKKELPFPLLSDPDHTMLKAYHAWGKKKLMGREYQGIKRISYLIDPSGKIAVSYSDVKPAEHARQVLADLDRLQAKK